jgi:hypothetical protein
MMPERTDDPRLPIAMLGATGQCNYLLKPLSMKARVEQRSRDREAGCAPKTPGGRARRLAPSSDDVLVPNSLPAATIDPSPHVYRGNSASSQHSVS